MIIMIILGVLTALALIATIYCIATDRPPYVIVALPALSILFGTALFVESTKQTAIDAGFEPYGVSGWESTFLTKKGETVYECEVTNEIVSECRVIQEVTPRDLKPYP